LFMARILHHRAYGLLYLSQEFKQFALLIMYLAGYLDTKSSYYYTFEAENCCIVE